MARKPSRQGLRSQRANRENMRRASGCEKRAPLPRQYPVQGAGLRTDSVALRRSPFSSGDRRCGDRLDPRPASPSRDGTAVFRQAARCFRISQRYRVQQVRHQLRSPGRRSVRGQQRRQSKTERSISGKSASITTGASIRQPATGHARAGSSWQVRTSRMERGYSINQLWCRATGRNSSPVPGRATWRQAR